jgi:hypothetical protein
MYHHTLAFAAQRDHDRRHSIAMRTNQRYAQIEALRHRNDGLVTLFDDQLDTTHWLQQAEVLNGVPRAPFMPVVDFLARRPVATRARNMRRAAQRARRGWDDTALWSLDTHICSMLSQQLRALAGISTGWPDQLVESHAEWTTALVQHADALGAYAQRESSPAHDRWYAALTAGSSDEECDALLAEAVTYEQRAVADAQSSLRWVADVLPHLWD